jgi:hypothetical protein
MLLWDGNPVEFNEEVGYGCKADNIFFEMDRDLAQWNMTCLPGGSWDEPEVWPICVPSNSLID